MVSGNKLKGGTIDGLDVGIAGSAVSDFRFFGFSIKAKELTKAISTTSTADDKALFAKMLKGKDILFGSNETGDVLSGYAKSDVLRGFWR